ncbi:MAG: metallophosphoesterase family protein [Pseudomonadota bacterium]
MSGPIYAVGDIHGYTDELERALELIERDGGANAETIFVGDYVDRGPDSAGVLDILIEGQAEGRNWITLKGNHDRLFEWFMEDPPRNDPHLLVGLHWFHERIGGLETMGSYGVSLKKQMRLKELHTEARENVPQSHVDFLRSLPLKHETPDLFFVHAGIRPGIDLDAQEEEDLLWIRTPFHRETRAHPKLIIHGHTPVDHATHYGNRVNLDSGAGYGSPISVAVFEGTQSWVLTANGRQKIRRG